MEADVGGASAGGASEGVGEGRMYCSHIIKVKREDQSRHTEMSAAYRHTEMSRCFTAIHTHWSYYEEGGDEGGVKLCKRVPSCARTRHSRTRHSRQS